MNCPVFQIKLRRWLRATLIVALCACSFFSAQSAVGQSPDTPKWLVLNNGQILDGRVKLADNKYTVVVGSGSQIVIAAEQVNFVADSINDIYWEKWSRVDPADAKSHMNLFRWCLKYNLLEEAQKQIDLVAKIENMKEQTDHLSRMAQELELVVQRIEKEAQLAQQKEIASLNIRNLPDLPGSASTEFAAAPTIPSAPIDAEGRPVRQLNQMNPITTNSAVTLVDFEEEISTSDTEPVSRRNKAAWVSNRQLDRETRAMPKGTVSFYKRHLESKLIANCIQCHDSRSASMPLSKRAIGQTIPRRMSQQNLHFVVEQVDRSTPFESPLLKMATTAHGQQESAAFNLEDPFLFELKKWSVAISDDPAAWLMKLSESAQSKVAEVQPAQRQENAVQGKPEISTDPAVEEIVELEVEGDPYDPSAFNRK